MYYKIILFCLMLAGCAAPQTKVATSLTPFAEQVIVKENETGQSFFAPFQDAPYSTILATKYQDMRFGFDNNISTLRISRLSNQQNRLPQLQPGVALRPSGNVELNLKFRQVLFDGGVYKAQHSSDDHEAVVRQIKLLRELNTEASKEVEIFLNYKENMELHVLLAKLLSHFQALADLAQTRVDGGIGSMSEVSLFQLKLSEVRTDARIANADAHADLMVLGPEIAKQPVAPFRFRQTHLPLSIVEAIAQREYKESALLLSRKETNPQVVLEGHGGYDPVKGLPSSDLGLKVNSAPIAFGGNVGVKSAMQELAMADHVLKTTVKDAERKTERIRIRIKALKSQQIETKNLTSQATTRFHSFKSQFRAGTANLTEAAGLLETMRQSMETQLRLKYEILNLERQLAEEGGHFWNLATDEDV